MDCTFKVHSFLGPGLLESSYEECLFFELVSRGIHAEKQKAMPLVYEGVKLNIGYRLDLLVENKVVIEIKAIDALCPIHTSQLLTYLKLSECRIGFLMNFNVEKMKDGIKTVSYTHLTLPTN